MRSKAKRRVRKVWITSFVIVVSMVLLFEGAVLSEDHSIDADLQAIHKLGIPSSRADLDALLPKNGANAAPVYLQAQDLLKRKVNNQWFVVMSQGVSDKATNEQVLDAKALLSKVSDVITLYRKGSQMPRCVFDGMTSTEGQRASFDQLETTKSQAAWLYYDAIFQDRAGNTVQARDDIRCIENICRQLDKNPTLMSQLCGRGLDFTTIRGLQYLLKRHMNDAAAIKSVAEIVESFPPLPDINAAYGQDLLESLADLDRERDDQFDDLGDDEKTLMGKLLRSHLARHHTAKVVARAWRRAFERMPKDPSDLKGIRDAFHSADSLVKSDWVAHKVWGDEAHPLADLDCDQWTEMLARRRLILLAAKIAQFRLIHGAFPRVMPNFGIDSIDPFTAKPMKYRVEGKGFIVYSVGRDGVDDGGKLHYQVMGSKSWDVPLDFR